jgi:hypothetical protein
MAFTIKQNDTLPNLPFKIFQPDGITAQNLSNVEEINIVVRTKGGTPASPVTFKKPCVILDQGVPANVGWGYYNFDPSDTATPGSYEYEFEIEWDDGNIQTVPVTGYLDLVIVDDIG